MLPVTLDWIRLDELFAKAFWSIDIITSPGTRNDVYESCPYTRTWSSST